MFVCWFFFLLQFKHFHPMRVNVLKTSNTNIRCVPSNRFEHFALPFQVKMRKSNERIVREQQKSYMKLCQFLITAFFSISQFFGCMPCWFEWMPFFFQIGFISWKCCCIWCCDRKHLFESFEEYLALISCFRYCFLFNCNLIEWYIFWIDENLSQRIVWFRFTNQCMCSYVNLHSGFHHRKQLGNSWGFSVPRCISHTELNNELSFGQW